LAVFDPISNVPISEEIAANIEYNTIYGFLEEAFREKPLFAVTTDHRRGYKEIMDDRGAKHPLCIFRLFKLIGADVYAVLKSNRASYRDKIKLCLISLRLRTSSGRTICGVLKSDWSGCWTNMTIFLSFCEERYIRKKLLQDFERLTLFMRDGLVSRTTNPVENYYRQTDPEQIKDTYKTVQGILSYLARKMDYWTAKLGRDFQHPTS